MHNGFQLNADGEYIKSPDFKKYNPLTGESKDTSTAVKKNTSIHCSSIDLTQCSAKGQ